MSENRPHMPPGFHPGDRLIEEALFLRMNGERPPGAPQHDLNAETWRDWERRAELYLRARPVNTAT